MKGALMTVQASTLQPRDVGWIWGGRIPRGMLTCLEGRQGDGKSTVLADVTARVSRGDPLPGDEGTGAKENVLVIAAEDSPEHVIRPRLEAAGADLDHVHIVTGCEGGAWWTVGAGADALEAKIIETSATLVIVDPITAHLGQQTDSHRDASTRAELDRLRAVAERTGAAIVYVLHFRKSAGDALDRASGSIAFTALPRSVLAFGPSPTLSNTLVLAQAKCNVGQRMPSLALRLVSAGPVAAVQWLGECDDTADDICAVRDPQKPRDGARAQAKDFLRRELTNGPVPSRQLFDQASLEGIARNTLYRASESLKVRKHKDGPRGPWFWELPHQAEHREVGEVGQVGDLGDEQGSLASPEDTQDAQDHQDQGSPIDRASSPA